MLQRREILAALSSATMATFVPGSVLAGTGLTIREKFFDLQGRCFRLTDSTGDVTTARLVTVDDGPSCPGLEQFSVVFECGDVTEGLYEVYHRETGRLLINLQRSGAPGSGTNRQRASFSNFV